MLLRGSSHVCFFAPQQAQQVKGKFESFRDPLDRFNRGLSFARFNHGEITTVDLCFIGQLALRDVRQ